MIWIRADLRALFGPLAFEEFLVLGQETAKRSATRHTAAFQRGGRRFFVKTHAGVGWGEIAKNWLQGKRPVVDARTEALALEHCAAHGIPAPRLAAWGRRGANPASRRSFVVTEALPAAERLSTLLATACPAFARRRALAHALGALVGRLHGSALAHRDLYLEHVFLAPGADGAFELYLLDLHRARPGRRAQGRWRVKDLAALFGSARRVGATRADAARFLRAYTAEADGLGRRARELWRRCARRAR